MMPVRIVSVAVTAGAPPIKRDISMDTAAVADLGASDRTVDAEAWAKIATDRPTTMLVSEPAMGALFSLRYSAELPAKRRMVHGSQRMAPCTCNSLSRSIMGQARPLAP